MRRTMNIADWSQGIKLNAPNCPFRELDAGMRRGCRSIGAQLISKTLNTQREEIKNGFLVKIPRSPRAKKKSVITPKMNGKIYKR
jgi:hypothetical protein